MTTSEPSRTAVVFDHLMHWVPDLDAAEADYRRAGFPLRTNPPRPGTGVRNGAWWKNGHYVETLAVIDATQARSSTMYGAFTRQILPAVEETVASGGGALNLAVLVDDVDAAVAAMGEAGIPAQQHTIRLRLGPVTVPAYTIGWTTDGPPWAPFVITYHPVLRRLQKVLLRLRRRRQPSFDIHHVVIEVPDPAAGAAWLGTVLGLPVQPGDRPAVSLGVCDAVFTSGSANRVTAVALTGPAAPDVTIAGLRYQPHVAPG